MAKALHFLPYTFIYNFFPVYELLWRRKNSQFKIMHNINDDVYAISDVKCTNNNVCRLTWWMNRDNTVTSDMSGTNSLKSCVTIQLMRYTGWWWYILVCFSMYACVTLCTHVFLFVRMCYYMYTCVTLWTHVLLCVRICYSMYACVTLCTHVLLVNANAYYEII